MSALGHLEKKDVGWMGGVGPLVCGEHYFIVFNVTWIGLRGEMISFLAVFFLWLCWGVHCAGQMVLKVHVVMAFHDDEVRCMYCRYFNLEISQFLCV